MPGTTRNGPITRYVVFRQWNMADGAQVGNVYGPFNSFVKAEDFRKLKAANSDPDLVWGIRVMLRGNDRLV